MKNKIGVKQYSVQDVKDANKRFYDKFPSAKEDAAMLKKAMLNPEDEIVKVVDQEKADREMMMKKFKIEIEIDD
jgi:DeoR/GlpR family transcriptional regulator of sugar metabolism